MNWLAARAGAIGVFFSVGLVAGWCLGWTSTPCTKIQTRATPTAAPFVLPGAGAAPLWRSP